MIPDEPGPDGDARDGESGHSGEGRRNPGPPPLWLRPIAFVGSALLAAMALRVAWEQPFAGLVLVGVFGGLWILLFSGRRHHVEPAAGQEPASGDGDLAPSWRPSLEDIPPIEAMGPLVTATALAGFGWIERARELLGESEGTSLRDQAHEHRLFLDAMLLTFEGNVAAAMDRADRLESIPIDESEPALERRTRVLRGAVGALARAFAHTTREGDRGLLLEAAQTSPFVSWAMRYGAAIAAVDAGDFGDARAILREAPSWPRESCFRDFHEQIEQEITRREG